MLCYTDFILNIPKITFCKSTFILKTLFPDLGFLGRAQLWDVKFFKTKTMESVEKALTLN